MLNRCLGPSGGSARLNSLSVAVLRYLRARATAIALFGRFLTRVFLALFAGLIPTRVKATMRPRAEEDNGLLGLSNSVAILAVFLVAIWLAHIATLAATVLEKLLVH